MKNIGFQTEKTKIFITVGTSPYDFKRMLKACEACISTLEFDFELIVQYGKSDPYQFPTDWDVRAESMFAREVTCELFQAADLVFSHCGIGSIHNALQFNRPTIIIPRLEKYQEFSDDHQLQIAKEIRKNPMVYMIDETLEIDGFQNFMAAKFPAEKASLDLTNKQLASFMQERLLGDNDQGDVLTVVSTGGHLTQALCIMTAIENFHIVTGGTFDIHVGAKSMHRIEETQFSAWIHFKNIFKALNIIRKVKPAAVFSTGGPICLPFALVCKLLNKKFIYLDTLSRVDELSNTARFLLKYKLTSEIYVQWKHHVEAYPALEYRGKTFAICGDEDF